MRRHPGLALRVLRRDGTSVEGTLLREDGAAMALSSARAEISIPWGAIGAIVRVPRKEPNLSPA